MAQIYLIWDEDTDEERHAMSASFADPYLAVLRDDFSLLLLQVDDSGDLDEVPIPDEISTSKWSSACLLHDKYHSFSPLGLKPRETQGGVLLFLLSEEHRLSVSYMRC